MLQVSNSLVFALFSILHALLSLDFAVLSHRPTVQLLEHPYTAYFQG